MDASNKQETISEKFVRTWEKKNAKAARAGGVSLMALSLAACGGSSSTTTTTTTTTTDTTTTTPAVDAAKTIALTTGTDSGASFTGGSGDDAFTATHATFGALDELDGGTGSDSLTIVNTGAANYTAATAKVKGIETINITSQNASSSATKEVAVVTFKDVGAYQSLTIDGMTFVAGAAGATAAQVATAFAGDAADSTDAGGALGATISGSSTSYAITAGSTSTSAKFTADTAGAATDLSASGTSTVAKASVQTITINTGTAANAADNTMAIVVDGTTITSKTAGATTTAAVVSQVADLANKINANAGKVIATHDGDGVIVISDTVSHSVANFAVGGTGSVQTATLAMAPTKSTITLHTTVPGATTADAAAARVNGEVIGTAALSADSVDAAGAALATAINNKVGFTAATYTDATNKLVIDGKGVPIIVTEIAVGNTVQTGATVIDVAGTGVASAAAAPTFSITQGAAAVTAQAYSTTVDASKFTDATTMASVNSTADVSFTNMVSTQAGVVSGNTAITNGNTTFGHKATATSFDIDIKDGTTAGNITATGAAATSANISSSGEKNTVGTIDVAAAKTITVDAATNLTATAIATTATAGTLTINGAGAVSIGTLDAGLDTVNAAGNSGGLTAKIGTETDTVITGSSGADKITASTTDTIADAAKLAVNAGAGTDTLIIGDASDVDTAKDGARYTGFEALEVATNQDVSLVAGIESVTVKAASAITGGVLLSGMNATNANAITVNTEVDGEFKVTLTNSTGTADSATINASSATATSNVNIEDIDVAGIETLTINATTGTTGTDSIFDIDTGGADKLTSLTIKGSADVDFNTSDAIAKGVTVDATSLTGDLTFAGNLIKGSAVNTGAGKDIITTTAAVTGTAGDYVSYNTGAGKDQITTTLAALHNVNSTKASVKIDGGADTDTMIMGATDATFTDVSFEHVKGIEVIQFEEEDADLSFTSGSNINANFAEKITLDFDTGMASGVDADIAVTADLGAYTGAATVKITSASAGTTIGDDLTVTTGSGADTVTITASSFTGGANKSVIVVSTGAGDDTITVSTGTLATTTTKSTITAGKGADTIDVTTHANGTAETKALTFVIAAGDSEASGYDKITGFDLGVNAGAWSDNLDLASANVSANTAGTNGTDSGSIKSHAITSGIITFDDADLFATALVIGKSDVSNVLTYLNNNITGTDTVAFAYDSSGNGTADSTIVFQQGATYDTVVELVDVVGLAVSATAGATAGLIHIM